MGVSADVRSCFALSDPRPPRYYPATMSQLCEDCQSRPIQCYHNFDSRTQQPLNPNDRHNDTREECERTTINYGRKFSNKNLFPKINSRVDEKLPRDNFIRQDACPNPKDGNKVILSDFKDRALKYYNTKIYHFRHCYNLLAKLFLNSKIEKDELELSEFERLVFLCVCRRKFTSLAIQVAKDQSMDYEFFIDLVTKCQSQASNKRVEEYTKFVLKHSMKHLKDRFRSLDLPANSNGSPPEFYQHYFKEVSEATGMPLEAFRDPLNNRKLKTAIMPKTLNSDYLQLIFKSRLFAKDIRFYISSNQLINDYMKSAPRKFEKILSRWERLADEKVDRRQFRDRLHEYFLRNKQCKLPWTANEISAAVNYFLGIMPPQIIRGRDHGV